MHGLMREGRRKPVLYSTHIRGGPRARYRAGAVHFSARDVGGFTRRSFCGRGRLRVVLPAIPEHSKAGADTLFAEAGYGDGGVAGHWRAALGRVRVVLQDPMRIFLLHGQKRR